MSQVVSALDAPEDAARPALAQLEAQGLCQTVIREGRTIYLFAGLKERKVTRRCTYCGSEYSVREPLHKCPSCGGNLVLRLGDETELIVCEYCDTKIDATSDQYRILGKMLRAGPEEDVIRIGMKAVLRGVEYEVVGKLRYRDVTP